MRSIYCSVPGCIYLAGAFGRCISHRYTKIAHLRTPAKIAEVPVCKYAKVCVYNYTDDQRRDMLILRQRYNASFLNGDTDNFNKAARAMMEILSDLGLVRSKTRLEPRKQEISPGKFDAVLIEVEEEFGVSKELLLDHHAACPFIVKRARAHAAFALLELCPKASRNSIGSCFPSILTPASWMAYLISQRKRNQLYWYDHEALMAIVLRARRRSA